MSIISVRKRMITLKIVYFGPALGGKTTSLQQIHRCLDPQQDVDLVSLATSGDTTLFFDFLPVDLGALDGFEIRVQGFTVPGQVKYARTRRIVLAGADGVVFVANSDPACAGQSAESLADFRENMTANGLDPETIPLVIQLNKRDMPDAVPVEDIRQEIQARPVPEFETSALHGRGTFEAFREIVKLTVEAVAAETKGRIRPGHAGAQVAKRLDSIRAESETIAVPTDLPVRDIRQAGGEEASERMLLEKSLACNMELSRLYAEANHIRRRLLAAVEAERGRNRLARKLLSAATPSVVWEAAHEACLELVPTRFSSVLAHPRRDDPLAAIALKGLDRDPLRECVKERTEELLRVIGKPTVLTRQEAPDVIRDMREVVPGLRGLVVVPLNAWEQLAGAILLYLGPDDAPIKDQNLRGLTHVAEISSLAISGALREASVVSQNRELGGQVEERTASLTGALQTIHDLNASRGEEDPEIELDRALDISRDFLEQTEKISSQVRMASGIAREMESPVSCVQDSLRSLSTAVDHANRVFENLEGALARDDAAAALTAAYMVLGDPESRALRDDLPRLARAATEEAGRVGRIAREMRGLSSLEPDDLARVDVHELLDRAISTVPTSIEVQREYAQVPPVPVYPRLLSKLLGHVFENSIRAMGGSGTLTVQTSVDDGMAVLAISDNGKGIPETALPHVFEPYFTTELAAGMGLFQVHRIADRHGGTVSIDSVAGRGAQLVVRLPLTQA